VPALVAVSLGFSLGLPVGTLPVNKLVGWDVLGEEVSAILSRHPELRFVASDDYGVTAELAFYVRPQSVAICLANRARRSNQYDVWGIPKMLGSEPGLLVLKDPAVVEDLEGGVTGVEEISAPLEIRYGSRTVRTFRFYRFSIGIH
jgi:hypothetical protein